MQIEEYAFSEGFDVMFDLNTKNSNKKIFDSVSGNYKEPFEPELKDLVRLHQLIRRRKAFTVLEFGVGYSSLVIADALMKNKKDWDKLPSVPQVRNSHLFELHAVDSSEYWITNVRRQMPQHLSEYVNFHFSEVYVGTFQDRLCHYYKNLPNIVPDFIYLDGPFPKHVKGEHNGMSFQCDERTVMSADILLMEPTLLPGTYILVDGRVNNVRFLRNNLQREYKFFWDKEEDVSHFELTEERLGKYNVHGFDFF